jgi:drug/metabolite transporter (DMT)-like permease
LPYVVLTFLSLLWGTSFLLIKIAAGAFDWTGYASGRAGIAAVALIAFAFVRGMRWPRALGSWARMAAISLTGQVGPFLLTGIAAHLTTSADLALMMGSAPIFTVVIARLFNFGEAWSARAAFGLALGFAGVAIALAGPLAAPLAVVPDPVGAAAPGLGRALALLAAFGYAIGGLLSRDVSRDLGADVAVTGSMSISAILLCAGALATAGPPLPGGLAAIPAGPFAALVTLALFNTALAYFVNFRLIESAGATFAALNNYIVPCLGVILGALALGERVGPSAFIGLACVLCGVVLTGSAAKVAPGIAPVAAD